MQKQKTKEKKMERKPRSEKRGKGIWKLLFDWLENEREGGKVGEWTNERKI